MYINHENIPKLPSSLLINVNKIQFRIFFIKYKITCVLCKSVGHTTTICKKNTENKLISDHLLCANVISPLDTTTDVLTEDTIPTTLSNLKSLDQTNMDWSKEIELSLQTNNIIETSHNSPPNETYKILFYESSSSKPPSSTNNPNSSKTIPNNEIVTKKPKMLMAYTLDISPKKVNQKHEKNIPVLLTPTVPQQKSVTKLKQ